VHGYYNIRHYMSFKQRYTTISVPEVFDELMGNGLDPSSAFDDDNRLPAI
jgi:hypothetical protein